MTTVCERGLCESMAAGAGLPVLFLAGSMLSVAVAGYVLPSAKRLSQEESNAHAPSVAASAMSPREEARLAEQLSAFALAKVAPERPDAEAMQGPPLDDVRFAMRRTHTVASVRKPERIATMLPPSRPARLAAVPPVAAPAASALPVVALSPVSAGDASPGFLGRVASLVPSPRTMFDGVRGVGDRLARYVPRL